MHKFNPGDFKKLESEERYRIMPPDILVKEIIKISSIYNPECNVLSFADIGCGSGFFSIPFIKETLGKNNGINVKVYAVDISKEMLERFRDKLKESLGGNDMPGVETVESSETAIPIKDASMDILLVAHVFHEVADKKSYINEIKRILKPGGVIFLVDWKKEDNLPPMGPPLKERVSREESADILCGAGFIDICEMPLYPASFTIVAKKG